MPLVMSFCFLFGRAKKNEEETYHIIKDRRGLDSGNRQDIFKLVFGKDLNWIFLTKRRG
jgi:hypothetical protein